MQKSTSQRVMRALLRMTKLDIKELRKAAKLSQNPAKKG